MKVYWDIDGVIRNLALGLEMAMHRKANLDGSDKFMDALRKFPNALRIAPTMEYYNLCKMEKKPEFITLQTVKPEYTMEWIKSRFNKCELHIVAKAEEKFKFLNGQNAILIDDSPEYDDYSQIILVDRSYNQHINARWRVKSPHDLEILLEYLNTITICPKEVIHE